MQNHEPTSFLVSRWVTHANGSADICTTWTCMFIKTDVLILLINLFRTFHVQCTDAYKDIKQLQQTPLDYTANSDLSKEISQIREGLYGITAITLINDKQHNSAWILWLPFSVFAYYNVKMAARPHSRLDKWLGT